jgi:phospholipid/cholesterol/gamma-HCH transport system substrate-binding protein
VTAGVKRRIVAFVVLSAVGIFYASANYLGLVDKLLGRGYSVTAELPGTGGLFEGSLVTYRGVKIGKVASMDPAGDGVKVHLDLLDEAKIPKDSPVYVHNGSAVGEQYLDFEPVSDEGPYLGEGDTIKGDKNTLPVDEADLLIDLDRFVGSVEGKELETVVGELGDMFFNTGRPLQDLIDGGTQLIDEASASQEETVGLLEDGRTVLQTQQDNAGNIRAFADGLAQVTAALRGSDQDLRRILQGGPGAMRQVQALLEGLEPTLPVMLSNMVTVGQVTTLRLPSVEQLLVTYPVVIASGYTGTTKDGYGHVHLEFTQDPPVCMEGYIPRSQWRKPSDLRDVPVQPDKKCSAGPPYVMRGPKYVPRPGSAARVAPYDAGTGTFGVDGQEYVIGGGTGEVYGKDAWKWMLIGPTLEK